MEQESSAHMAGNDGVRLRRAGGRAMKGDGEGEGGWTELNWLFVFYISHISPCWVSRDIV